MQTQATKKVSPALSAVAAPAPLEELIADGRMTVTPDLAERIVTERVYARQRPVENFHVTLLAEMLRRGEFKDGRQIWFGVANGRLHLIDGQHRLRAVIISGVSAVFEIQLLPLDSDADLHEAYITFDRIGRPRTTPEVLQALGVADQYKLGKQIAASVFRAAFLIHFKFAPPHHTADPIAVRSDTERMRYAEPYWAVAAQYEKIISSASGIARKRLRAPQILAVGLITLVHQKELAAVFWKGLSDNDGLRRGDSRHSLLKWLNDHDFDRRGYTGATAAALAWNAFYEHRNIETLRVGSVANIRIAGTPFKGDAR